MQVEDPWTSEFLKYKELGFSHEEVGMPLGVLGPDADQDSQVRHTTSSPSGDWSLCHGQRWHAQLHRVTLAASTAPASQAE